MILENKKIFIILISFTLNGSNSYQYNAIAK